MGLDSETNTRKCGLVLPAASPQASQVNGWVQENW